VRIDRSLPDIAIAIPEFYSEEKPSRLSVPGLIGHTIDFDLAVDHHA
jgi:hypothetical protein